MRIIIVTDAWYPQLNGVVRTYEQTRASLEAMGHRVKLLTPAEFRTVPCPTYPSIRLAAFPARGVANILDNWRADAIHIATEGPLGHAAHRYCRRRDLPFTTSFHTRFPEYIRARAPIPMRWSYAYLRRFHAAAVRTLVPTESQRRDLADKGFQRLGIWGRGVDAELFRPRAKTILGAARPVSMYVGRVAVEKNIESYLSSDIPGTKVVIGDGPELVPLRNAYPGVRFLGQKTGEALATLLAAADVFVFPSRTDTFGIVMLEAMACGVPVAAYPVTGPLDLVQDGVTGALDEDLAVAARRAIALNPGGCVRFARSMTWSRSSEVFLDALALLSPVQRRSHR
jgi:1,2-diacylglycerol 3-alpha-glucosyltransferase/glucuronosyltransferase